MFEQRLENVTDTCHFLDYTTATTIYQELEASSKFGTMHDESRAISICVVNAMFNTTDRVDRRAHADLKETRTADILIN